eukprot:scaffold8667_cov63-Skeletonema_menzelii.AAC.1
MRLCLTLALRSPRSNRLNPFSLSSSEGDSPLPPFCRMLKSDVGWSRGSDIKKFRRGTKRFQMAMKILIVLT